MTTLNSLFQWAVQNSSQPFGTSVPQKPISPEDRAVFEALLKSDADKMKSLVNVSYL